jgi:hypothetical protein
MHSHCLETPKSYNLIMKDLCIFQLLERTGLLLLNFVCNTDRQMASWVHGALQVESQQDIL